MLPFEICSHFLSIAVVIHIYYFLTLSQKLSPFVAPVIATEGYMGHKA